MLDLKTKGILLNIIKKCERIESIVNGKTKEEFESNNDLIELACFNIFQIGELANKLNMDFVKKYKEVPWREIVGMRHVIVHGYDSIDVEIVWATSTEDSIFLKNKCIEILNEA